MIDPAEFAEAARSLKSAAAKYEATCEGLPEDRIIAHVALSEARTTFIEVVGRAFADA